MPRVYLLLLISLFSSNLFASMYLKEVVSYLASDQLEGRKPGLNGNVLATKYLEDQLRIIGLQPLAGSFTQDFTIFTEMQKNGTNHLATTSGKAEAKFEPISYSLSGDLHNTALAFAGYGITIADSDTNIVYDDYAGLDVKDKIVIVMTGDPGIGNSTSVFRKPEYLNYRSLFYKLKNAITHGASGIIIINDPLSLSDYPNEPDPYFNNTEGGGNRFSIISGYARNSYIDNLMLTKKLTTLRLQKKIARTQKPCSFELGLKMNMSVHLKKKTGRVSNIVGVVNGSDTSLAKEVVVIGAHMDHLGFGGESSMEPGSQGKIHNGADDNASGTAMVLALAKQIVKLNPKRTYLFSLFNAEEMGLLGSSHFVSMWESYAQNYGQLVAMLNFDMVGRYQKELSVMGTDTALIWPKLIPQTSTADFTISTKKDALASSDHASFINKKIPSLFFTTGAHEDYHRSSDDTDKIDFKAMDKLESFAMNLIGQIDGTSKIEFNPNYTSQIPGGTRGYGAHLGCVPKFGQDDSIIGVECIDTTENSPARKAGLVAGDILVEIGDIEIKNIYDLAFALKYYRAGDKVSLAWKHNGQLLKQMITLAKSSRN